MVQRASNNAKHNEINNVNFFVADLTENISKHVWFKQNYSKIVIDPPRSGALEVLNQLSYFLPERIVYISCNPATFARDAGILVHQHGFRFKQYGILDMFPHTNHIETIALFIK